MNIYLGLKCLLVFYVPEVFPVWCPAEEKSALGHGVQMGIKVGPASFQRD